MPKKIKNVRARLMAQAKELLRQDGYAKLTMRSVAAACGLGIGTAYNYFSSKDMLIACVLLSDWMKALTKMKECGEPGVKKVECAYQCLQEFIAQNRPLFGDESAKKSYAESSPIFHKQLRNQLAEAILPVCKGAENESFLALFLADVLLSWSVEGVDFSNLAPIVEKIIK